MQNRVSHLARGHPGGEAAEGSRGLGAPGRGSAQLRMVRSKHEDEISDLHTEFSMSSYCDEASRTRVDATLSACELVSRTPCALGLLDGKLRDEAIDGAALTDVRAAGYIAP